MNNDQSSLASAVILIATMWAFGRVTEMPLLLLRRYIVSGVYVIAIIELSINAEIENIIIIPFKWN
jgi:hypothetical protein